MLKMRIASLLILLAAFGIGYFVYTSETNENSNFRFKLGLDLSGGSHLIYRADTSQVPPGDVEESMQSLRDVIERRVNLFGVSEPIVQVESSSALSEVEEERLVVELPGVTDVEEAVALIGETPVLEFMLLKEGVTPPEGAEEVDYSEYFETTGLTGRFLDRAVLEFGSTQGGGLANEPIVVLQFDNEGAELFAAITRDNVGRVLAIFLDGEPISVPVIREEIPGGEATISGNFEPEEARDLVRNLNFGALPLPIELISTQSIGASLGRNALDHGVTAGLIGVAAVALFLMLWYRLPGVIAVVSLSVYILIMLTIFKLVPVTLTAAGLAGFILSIGMAVDANILIFERMREEFLGGADTHDAVKNGFARAWVAIRDANISSVISAVILFWFGTSLVEGFALTFGIGVLVSMLSAITITRTFLYAFSRKPFVGGVKTLFGSGFPF